MKVYVVVRSVTERIIPAPLGQGLRRHNTNVGVFASYTSAETFVNANTDPRTGVEYDIETHELITEVA